MSVREEQGSSTHYLPAAPADGHGVRLDITPESAGWGYSGLRVIELAPAAEFVHRGSADEIVIVPLAGGCTVTAGADTAVLLGRESVFSAVTDIAYVPSGRDLTISTPSGGRFALASARTDGATDQTFRHVRADEVQVELRGAGNCSRQVNNFATPSVLDAERIIACEVLTPAGNWSSYPPHKHDEDRPGESVLEEIYYFEVSNGGHGYQRVYGTPDRPIDVLAQVGSGDAVLIPHGWHGPSMAPPGYDLYYLNVMAGPGAREWLICDDPDHAWIRGTWAEQSIDPRLPMTGAL